MIGPTGAPGEGDAGHDPGALLFERCTLVGLYVHRARGQEDRPLVSDRPDRQRIGGAEVALRKRGSVADPGHRAIPLTSGLAQDREHARSRVDLLVLDPVGAERVDDREHVCQNGVANDRARYADHRLGKQRGGAEGDLVREHPTPRNSSRCELECAWQVTRAGGERLPDPVGEGFVQIVDQVVDVHQYPFDSFQGDSDTLNLSSTTMARHCSSWVALKPENWVPTQLRIRSFSR